MEFTIPKFNRKSKPCGVYKLIFDDKWVYIGSSKELKSRIRNWRSTLNTHKGIKNENIIKILPLISVIKFEIISSYEYQKGVMKMVIKEETKAILDNWDNPFILNICPHALTGQFNYKKRKRKKVAQYDKNGNFIALFESCKDVINTFGMHHNHIRKSLTNVNGYNTCYGYIWKYA